MYSFQSVPAYSVVLFCVSDERREQSTERKDREICLCTRSYVENASVTPDRRSNVGTCRSSKPGTSMCVSYKNRRSDPTKFSSVSARNEE